MKKQQYYTNDEIGDKLDMLHLNSKPLTDICKDPRCPTAIKENQEALKSLQLQWDALKADFITNHTPPKKGGLLCHTA